MMKVNSKKTVVFIFSLSVLQVVIVSPVAFAVVADPTITNTEQVGSPTGTQDPQNPRMGNRQRRMGGRPELLGNGNNEIESEQQAKWQGRRPANSQENNQQGNADTTNGGQDVNQAPSCDRINTQGQNQLRDFSSKLPAFREKFSDPKTAFGTSRDTSDAALNDLRGKQDEARNTMYMKLEENAQTDAQKAAVAAFKVTVEQAVTDRRTAVDEAIAAFRKDVDALMGSKTTAVTGAMDTFQASVKAAFETAQTSCASGADPKTVRDTLRASLKDARAKLQVSRQSVVTAGDTIPALAATKKTAIDKAMQDFKTTMEKARTDLKAAFQQ
jgi:hypothetical protein